jgi:hypothetical protein
MVGPHSLPARDPQAKLLVLRPNVGFNWRRKLPPHLHNVHQP